MHKDASTTTADTRIHHIGNVTFETGSGEQIALDTDSYRLPIDTGDNSGRLLLELDVDGEFTHVSVDAGRTGTIQLLEVAIARLTELHTGLTGLYPGGERGQCLARGDWGRCEADRGHTDEHAFPTEEAWRARFLAPVVSA